MCLYPMCLRREVPVVVLITNAKRACITHDSCRSFLCITHDSCRRVPVVDTPESPVSIKMRANRTPVVELNTLHLNLACQTAKIKIVQYLCASHVNPCLCCTYVPCYSHENNRLCLTRRSAVGIMRSVPHTLTTSERP